jgi:hypothetical protein
VNLSWVAWAADRNGEEPNGARTSATVTTGMGPNCNTSPCGICGDEMGARTLKNGFDNGA